MAEVNAQQVAQAKQAIRDFIVRDSSPVTNLPALDDFIGKMSTSLRMIILTYGKESKTEDGEFHEVEGTVDGKQFVASTQAEENSDIEIQKTDAYDMALPVGHGFAVSSLGDWGATELNPSTNEEKDYSPVDQTGPEVIQGYIGVVKSAARDLLSVLQLN